MSSSSETPDFSSWRVGELRRYLHERGVSTAGATERSELVALAEAAASGTATVEATRLPVVSSLFGPHGAAATWGPNVLEALSSFLADPSNQAQLDAAAEALVGGLAERVRLNPLVDVSPGVRISMTPLPAAEAERLIGGPGAQLLFRGSGPQVDQLLGGVPGTAQGAGGSSAEVADAMGLGRREGSGGNTTAAVGSAAGVAADAAGNSDSGAAGISSGRSSAPGSSSGARGGAATASGAAPASTAAKHCAVCDKAAEPGRKLKRCGGCLKVRYCSVECQSRHWAEGHKRECRRLREEAA